jgi:leucyl-tRNA synthetase
MLLQACADKLAREIATYGNPPKFPTEEEAAAAAAEQPKQVLMHMLNACLTVV